MKDEEKPPENDGLSFGEPVPDGYGKRLFYNGRMEFSRENLEQIRKQLEEKRIPVTLGIGGPIIGETLTAVATETKPYIETSIQLTSEALHEIERLVKLPMQSVDIIFKEKKKSE